MATGEGQSKRKAGKGPKKKKEAMADKPLRTRTRGKKRKAAKHSQPGWKAKTADALLAVLVNKAGIDNNLMSLQQVLGYTFRDPKLLEQALTHASGNIGPHNGRLAWLGDAVLKLVVSEMLFSAQPGSTSGELTQARQLLEARRMCAQLGSRLGIGELLRQRRGGRPATPDMEAEAVEAVLGAVYLDSGLSMATVKQVYVAIGQLGSAGGRVAGGGLQEPARPENVAEASPSSAPYTAQQQQQEQEQEQLFSYSRPAEEGEMEGEAGGSQGASAEARGWRFRWRQISGARWLREWLRW